MRGRGWIDPLREQARPAAALIAAAALAGTLQGCDSGEGCACGPFVDVVAPATVTTLAVSTGQPCTGYFTLTWAATGDDGATGTAAAYDVRYNQTGFTSADDWTQATALTDLPVPRAAGSAETLEVHGLTIGSTYHFALMVGDDAGNWSRRSNAASAVLCSLDTAPPAAVIDLRVDVAAPSATSLRLLWTAVGDDSLTGTAAAYDVRYDTVPIDSKEAWDEATPVPVVPAPRAAGAAESLVVQGLSTGSVYHFALKVRDEANNESVRSNSASGELIPPAAVDDLHLSPAGTTSTTLRLLWTAVGDDDKTGTAAAYDLRYNTTGIAGEADWEAATHVAGAPPPGEAGSPESLTVAGLLPETTYFFAVKVIDDAGLLSPLSNVASGATAGAHRWRVDPGGGGDFTRIQPAIDAAAGRDTIEVAAGVYSDTLRIVDKALYLLGAGADICVVAHSPQNDPVLTIAGSPGLSISGFGFTQEHTMCGNGVLIDEAQVVFEACALTHCGLTAQTSTTEMRRCTIDGQCLMDCDEVVPMVQLIGGNAQFENCILSTVGAGNDQLSCDPSAQVDFACCDILTELVGCPDPLGANGNFALDPLYVDAAGGDFHLLPASPCLPELAPAGCGLVGVFGTEP